MRCEESLRTNKLETLSCTRPHLTLYISNYDVLKASLLYNLGRLAISKSSLYVCEWDLFMAIMPVLVFFPPSFCLTIDLQKCHIRWQYVRSGKIKAFYSNSLALGGIKFHKRDSIPTFRLVFIHSSLICFLKSRSSSMWTPSSLMSSDLSMGRPSRLSTASLVSPSIFLGLIFRN